MSRTAAALTGLFVAYAALYYQSQLGDVWHSGDFAALWSYGRVLRSDGAAALYDAERLHTLQVALGLSAAHRYPFPYPPGFLPIMWPLGLLPFGVAFVAWTVVTLGAFLIACRGRLGWVALIAPGTTIAVIAGQSGSLSGALFVGGLRLIDTRPWLGGVLLGLLTFKPQLGVLIPVALAALGAWRAVAGATLGAVGLAFVGLALFGSDTAGLWLASLPAYAADFDTSGIRPSMMPTTTANLTMLGVPAHWVMPGQAVFAVLAAAVVWRVFRSARRCGGREMLVLAAATFVATPHAFVYDLPMLTGAALLYGASGRAAIVVAVLLLPAAMLWSGAVPLSTPVLAGVLAALCWPLSGRTPHRFNTDCRLTSDANTATAATRTLSSSR